MTELLIIADDLSGAADCAGGCRLAGLEAIVTYESVDGANRQSSHTSQVLAVDADTRRASPAQAADTYTRIHRQYAGHGSLLYMKLDSTLRGNFCAELSALCALAGMAIMAPAFPATGRVTRNGHQFIADAPLEETDIWKHERLPGTANIAGMLGREGLRCASLSLAQLHGGVDAVQSHIRRCAAMGIQVLVCDAESDADLRLIAHASAGLAERIFWAGSAGLMRQLAPILKIPRPGATPNFQFVSGAILAVVGSASAISLAQKERLNTDRSVSSIEAPAAVLKAGPGHEPWDALGDRLLQAFRQGDVLLSLRADESTPLEDGPVLCQALARLIAPHADQIGAIIATGGETAKALLSALGITALRVAAEVDDGVPQSWACSPRPIPIITKAGAFGSPHTLVHCYDYLQRMRSMAGAPPSRHSVR